MTLLFYSTMNSTTCKHKSKKVSKFCIKRLHYEKFIKNIALFIIRCHDLNNILNIRMLMPLSYSSKKLNNLIIQRSTKGSIYYFILSYYIWSGFNKEYNNEWWFSSMYNFQEEALILGEVKSKNHINIKHPTC